MADAPKHPASDPPPGPVSAPEAEDALVFTESAVENGDTVIALGVNEPGAEKADAEETAPPSPEEAGLQAEITAALNGDPAEGAISEPPDEAMDETMGETEDEPSSESAAESTDAPVPASDPMDEEPENEDIRQESSSDKDEEQKEQRRKRRAARKARAAHMAPQTAAVAESEDGAVDEPAEPAYPDFFQCYPLPPGASLKDFEVRKLLIGLYTGRGGLTNYFI